MKPGLIRLQQWSPDFNPHNQRPTNAQVWIRIHDLSWEYWHPKILTNLASAIGHPLKIDNATLNGDYGHYARVLVDVDLSKNLLESVMMERDGFCFFVSITYENLPDFCNNCSAVGHSIGNCKRILNKGPKGHEDKPEATKSRHEYHPKEKKIPAQLASNPPLEVPASSKSDGATEKNKGIDSQKDRDVLAVVPFTVPNASAFSPNSASLEDCTQTNDSQRGEYVSTSHNNTPILQEVSKKSSELAPITEHVLSSDKTDSIQEPSSISVCNPEGIPLSINLPGTLETDLPAQVMVEIQLAINNSWADLSETEHVITKRGRNKLKKPQDKTLPNRPTTRKGSSVLLSNPQ